MAATPGRKKMPPSGGLLEGVKQRDAVYRIIRDCQAAKPSPVRFKVIQEGLTPPPGSIDTTWRRVAAQRALKSLQEMGWVGRTSAGYVDLKSPLYLLHGLRVSLESELEHGTAFLSPGAVPTEGELYQFGRDATQWSRGLAYVIGPWLRSIDDQLISRAKSLGAIEPDKVQEAQERAARVAETLTYAYLLPEVEKTLEGIGDFGSGWFKELTSNPEVLPLFLKERRPPEKFRGRDVHLKELERLMVRLKPLEREVRKQFMEKGMGDVVASVSKALDDFERTTLPKLRRLALQITKLAGKLNQAPAKKTRLARQT
jgi:hypothetical protein